MASLYDTSANSAFNEDKYINKIYDGTLDSHKKAVQQGYDKSVQQLSTGQQSTQKQTADYLDRAHVEGQRASGHMQKPAGGGSLGTGAGAQARLALSNQMQANSTALKQQQTAADQEFERRRKMLGEKYAALIKQAQADNDMARAQALYAAAKAEEDQLRGFRQSAATLMQSKGDNSIMDAIGRGDAVTPDTDSETWESVLKNEDGINKIFDAQMESQQQAAEIAHMEEMAELDAAQQKARQETDRSLTDAYVDALKKNQNYQEVQTAYGQGSGASMQARLARETGLTKKLTDLRRLQQGKDAGTELDRAALVHSLGEKIAGSRKDIDQKRAEALYEAAEKEEQNLVADQQFLGEQLAKQGDYSVLGKLYGLTEEQMRLLMPSGGGGGVYYKKKKDESFKDGGKYIQAIKDAYESISRPSINAEAFNGTVKTKYGTK